MKNNIKTKNNNILIIILIISLLITCSYIIYDKVFSEEKSGATLETKKENKKEQEKPKEENLDINSRLVQTLYTKVVDNDGMSKYWMYDNYLNSNNTTDYLVAKSDLETKMHIVGNNLDEGRRISIDCNSSIPNTIKIYNIDYKSACYAISQGAFGYSPLAYNRSYVEMIYKSLFGNDAKLDTSIDFRINPYAIEIYHYVASLDKYVLYVTEGGGTGASNYSGVVTKATKSENEIKIYEKVTYTTPETTEEYNYIYRFKLEDDGMYSFISRIKES